MPDTSRSCDNCAHRRPSELGQMRFERCARWRTYCDIAFEDRDKCGPGLSTWHSRQEMVTVTLSGPPLEDARRVAWWRRLINAFVNAPPFRTHEELWREQERRDALQNPPGGAGTSSADFLRALARGPSRKPTLEHELEDPDILPKHVPASVMPNPNPAEPVHRRMDLNP